MDTKQLFISVVIPVYGCELCLEQLYLRLKRTLEPISSNFEIILVNDASPDESWNTIKYLAEMDSRVKGINLSRNFGQHYAITAGLDYAHGEWVVVMDCDLQDQPEEITKLYNTVSKGYDVVFGRRHERKDTFLKKLGSFVFFKILDYFTDSKSDNSIANFSISSNKVIRNFRMIKEQGRSFPLFVKWLGFNIGYVDIEHSKRLIGKTSYNFKKLFKFAINNIIFQSNKPLQLSIVFGFLISLVSCIFGMYLMIRYFFLNQPVSGWTSLIVSLYLIGGLLFANMGILGLYIGKTFSEVKKRPLYVVKNAIGIKIND
ncbi:glycosyltransferase [Paenibacillus psychroresistens]|uniref:Glycosyltransferase n=1 Tax=Paenibacillus psychroresistens TaxID=1778678 RepID=A0A6B8RRX7_9BACL|nr:glycosyltransferase family 2 protein [Paenibacillus psychroresistens]QGQ98482.1 glycosyltransferase [Paenibacillus psychroresistens]